MATPLEKLKLEALSLTPQERATLAHLLILSLEETIEEKESEKEISDAWNMEIKNRIEAIEAGSASARSAGQVIAEIKAKYKK
jgi:hypothetical protein